MATTSNEVLTIDLGELNGDRFLVIVDWATRYCQAVWTKLKSPEEIMEILMLRGIIMSVGR